MANLYRGPPCTNRLPQRVSVQGGSLYMLIDTWLICTAPPPKQIDHSTEHLYMLPHPAVCKSITTWVFVQGGLYRLIDAWLICRGAPLYKSITSWSICRGGSLVQISFHMWYLYTASGARDEGWGKEKREVEGGRSGENKQETDKKMALPFPRNISH